MKNLGIILSVAGLMICLIASVSDNKVHDKAIDEIRICSIKAAEFQKNYVMKEGQCLEEK